MSSSSRVLVSGASGYLGTQIVNELLASGYSVRALVRGSKVAPFKKAYADAGDRVEVFEINDISQDTFTTAFDGIGSLIHSASPLPGKGTPEELLQAAIEGTLNIIRQAEKAGIKKVVFTSSFATVRNAKNSFTAEDWNPVTKEEALAGTLSEMGAYAASKTYAERAVWDWAEAHPHVDVTVLNPSFFYGALAPQLQALIPSDKANDYSLFSTTISIYQLLFPEGKFTSWGMFIDIKDLAKLHVLSLTGKPATEVGRKRLIIANPNTIDWNEAMNILRDERPELVGRLIKGEASPTQPSTFSLDFERLEEVLGFKKTDFSSFQKTLLETVDSLLEVESRWKANGSDILAPASWGY
ncbi:hypothetical protein DL96DRAFT_1698918 [Flagelloscypha sp. PMI_526]|nr:hypothetical protein DL96DRAFT_1698918 [Flagelloscypha sp. PMI_526]